MSDKLRITNYVNYDTCYLNDIKIDKKSFHQIWDLQKEIEQLKQQLQVVLDQDKLRGYPTGVEWLKMIKQIKTKGE